MKKLGRPSKYTDELAEKICIGIATSSKGLNTLCKENEDWPDYATIFNWLSDKKHTKFLEQYTRAREDQADYLADEIVKIADDAEGDNAAFVGINRVHRAKLQVESRKWVAAKLKPKKYGDNQKVDITVKKIGKDLEDETYE